MSDLTGQPAGLIWATRGRHWGFRFLLDGGLSDPLATYEDAFSSLEDEATVCQRGADGLALRFPDPLQRRDSARRIIPHDFVVLGDLATQIDSVDAGIELIWPLVADAYGRVWEDQKAPASDQLVF